ncbi:hypothetical protein R50076_07560 [Gilvimarinus japonicus]
MALRFKALLVHLLISSAILLGVVAVIYWWWFPGALIKLGAMEGLAIIALVDIVLGPLLTFIVFNPTKKTLKLDLSIIALLQLCGLAYGLLQLESQRVVAQILMGDQLHIVHKTEMVDAGHKVADIKEKFGEVPVSAFYNVFEAPGLVRGELAAIALREGEPLYQIKYYLVIAKAKEDAGLKSRLDFWLSRLEYDKEEGCYWVELIDKYVEGKACFSADGDVLTVEAY